MSEDDTEAWREIICPDCGGEGFGEIVDSGRYDPVTGDPERRPWTCKTCNGTSGIWVQVEPITMDDLAEIAGEDDPYSAFAYRGGNP